MLRTPAPVHPFMWIILSETLLDQVHEDLSQRPGAVRALAHATNGRIHSRPEGRGYASADVRRLFAHRLIRRVGQRRDGAGCFTITDKGRAVLALFPDI